MPILAKRLAAAALLCQWLFPYRAHNPGKAGVVVLIGRFGNSRSQADSNNAGLDYLSPNVFS